MFTLMGGSPISPAICTNDSCSYPGVGACGTDASGNGYQIAQYHIDLGTAVNASRLAGSGDPDSIDDPAIYSATRCMKDIPAESPLSNISISF